MQSVSNIKEKSVCPNFRRGSLSNYTNTRVHEETVISNRSAHATPMRFSKRIDSDSEEESTDNDELTDPEDEVLAVGTSVSDAVKGLNNKRAAAKVKRLFGIRG